MFTALYRAWNYEKTCALVARTIKARAEFVTPVQLERGEYVVAKIDDLRYKTEDEHNIVIPIFYNGEVLGKQIFHRHEAFEDEDKYDLEQLKIMLSAIYVISHMAERTPTDEIRRKQARHTLEKLTPSEYDALVIIAQELKNGGLIIASAIAKAKNISKTVICAALKKCEIGGCIETRSLGAKGTFVRVLNEYIIEEIQ